MSLREIIKKAEVAALEIAAGDAEWWKTMTSTQKKEYIKKYPNSKYAKNSTSKPVKNSEGEIDGPKARGPKAFFKDKKAKLVDKPNSDRKTTKDNTKDKKEGIKTKRRIMSNKEKIKHKILRIKNMQGRLVVLAAEKAYRNAAKIYTQRDTTKERLSERIKKISELTKTIQLRIKNYEKRIKELSN